MTGIATTVAGRFADWLEMPAPAERLALFRVVLGVYTVVYFALRTPVIWALRNRSPAEFTGVGPLWWLREPVPDVALGAALVAVLVLGVAFTLGVGFRLVGPALALVVLAITTYRSSWGQLLHFENLLALHLLILAPAAAADAWAVGRNKGAGPAGEASEPGAAYGWPLRLASLVTVVTYVLAGVAKLRLGGVDWLVGDTLENHVAYSATRLEVLGATPPPLAGVAVGVPALLVIGAVATVVIELVAPVALLGGRVRTLWVLAAWIMHAAIVALMFVVFPYPLFLVAFAPLFELERGPPRLKRGLRRLLSRLLPRRRGVSLP